MEALLEIYAILRHRVWRRAKNRLKYLINDLSDLWSWEFESCERCGRCFRLAYSVDDEIWEAVYGSEDGCLCPECFLVLAEKQYVYVEPEHFDWLSIFTKEGQREDFVRRKRHGQND
jgi:hypothetical protein